MAEKAERPGTTDPLEPVRAAARTGHTGLPPGVEAAWGLRERPHRGPKPGLSLPRIVEAGVKIAESEGLAAVSMSRVAAEVGAAPMSLYRHVASKDELVALMVDTVYGQFLVPMPAGQGWRAGLAQLARVMRAAMYRHPWILRVPIGGLPVRPNEVAWFEQVLACLHGTGLTEEEKASVVLLVSGYVRSQASTNADIIAAVQASGLAPDEWMSGYGRLLARLTDPARFPAITRFIAAGVFERFDPPDNEFTFGLDRILDGIGVLVTARSRPEPE